jgi:hypothetical protein
MSGFYILPNLSGTNPINGFNFFQVPTNASFTPIQSNNVNPNFRFYEWTPSEDFNTLVQAKKTANSTKNEAWQKILNAVLLYGPAVFGILQQSGVLNSSRDLRTGNINQDAFNRLNQGVGGDFSIDKLENFQNRNANILGLNTSTLILLGVGFLGFMIYSNRPQSKK